MTKDKYDLLGPIMSDIGQEAVHIVGGDRSGILLYAEIGDRWNSLSLFRDEGDVVRYFRMSERMDDLLWEAWYAESEEGGNKRWSVLEYDIHDGKFDASFRYPDQVDVEIYDHGDQRRQSAVRARFGDKPVVYPPFPGTGVELKP
jgi:hypothetical protein